MAKAIAAGASGVMLASLFAGSEEAPGEIELFRGARTSLPRHGFARRDAEGSSDRSSRRRDECDKLVPEGSRRIRYKDRPPHHPAADGRLRASMGYTGAGHHRRHARESGIR